jgi:hypothetical protein
MGEGEASWWLDADRAWHQGTPPRGWQQTGDGRWHPPPGAAGNMDPTVEQEITAAHRAVGAGSRSPRGAADIFRDAPQWLRIACGVLAAVVVIAVAGVALMATRPADPGSAAPAAAADTTSSTATSTTTTSTTTTSTTVPTTTTAPPPPAAPTDPLALCSHRQRRLIERSHRSPEWVRARFDPDGDGIFCNSPGGDG